MIFSTDQYTSAFTIFHIVMLQKEQKRSSSWIDSSVSSNTDGIVIGRIFRCSLFLNHWIRKIDFPSLLREFCSCWIQKLRCNPFPSSYSPCFGKPFLFVFIESIEYTYLTFLPQMTKKVFSQPKKSLLKASSNIVLTDEFLPKHVLRHRWTPFFHCVMLEIKDSLTVPHIFLLFRSRAIKIWSLCKTFFHWRNVGTREAIQGFCWLFLYTTYSSKSSYCALWIVANSHSLWFICPNVQK